MYISVRNERTTLLSTLSELEVNRTHPVVEIEIKHVLNHLKSPNPVSFMKPGSRVKMAHRALSQGRDDISQSRKRLVDVFSLIQDGSCSSSLTDLE